MDSGSPTAQSGRGVSPAQRVPSAPWPQLQNCGPRGLLQIPCHPHLYSPTCVPRQPLPPWQAGLRQDTSGCWTIEWLPRAPHPLPRQLSTPQPSLPPLCLSTRPWCAQACLEQMDTAWPCRPCQLRCLLPARVACPTAPSLHSLRVPTAGLREAKADPGCSPQEPFLPLGAGVYL